MGGGVVGGGGCGISDNEFSCAHGTRINFRDQTPYLAYTQKEKFKEEENSVNAIRLLSMIPRSIHTTEYDGVVPLNA